MISPKAGEPKIYGEVCYRRKQRRKRQKILVFELFTEYAKNSTLHGLRYTTERGLTVIEKLFWLLTFLISVGMCVFLIRNVWLKWKTSPVIVSFSEEIVPVGKVPFPSITICPQLKCMATKYNYTKEYSNYFAENGTRELNDNPAIEKLEDVSLVCSPRLFESKLDRTYSNSSVVHHIYKVAPDVMDFMLLCTWRDQQFDCKEYFKMVLTSEGVCYNFNALAVHEIFRMESIQTDYVYLDTHRPSKSWTVNKGYTDPPDMNPYPRRARENGATPDLEVVLKELPVDRDGFCNGLRSGYKIYVQHPADFPQDSLYYYAALQGQVSSLALKFNMVTTSESLESYDSEIRQCYFPDDRPLKFFKIYTPNNCRLECRANYTFEKCGCVQFNMPYELTEQELHADLGKLAKIGTCRCLPACYSVSYDAEILKTEFDFNKFIDALGKLHNFSVTDETMYDVSKIEVYFKEPRFVSVRRSELFGLTDFMANIGGLLGLFLGFSFLSLVEIAYFITIRLCCLLRRDLQEEKANMGKDKESIE